MEQLTYLDFDLKISEGKDDPYVVEVVHSPDGESPAIPLRDTFRNLLTASYDSVDVASSRALGLDLFGAVIHDEILTCFEVSQQIAKDQGKGLRIRLHISPPELLAIPWEFLYDPRRQNISVYRAIRRSYVILSSRSQRNHCW